MKRVIVLLGVLVFSVSFSVQSASAITVWATDAIWYEGENATPGSNRGLIENALGAPDDDFLSLGLGGYAIFDFGAEFETTAMIFETTWGNRDNYYEEASVWVADSNFDFDSATLTEDLPDLFSFVSTIDNQQEQSIVDLSGAPNPAFRYIAIQDTSPSQYSNRDGFDVNAVGVEPVPEPSTIILLGFGLMGMVFFRKLHANKKN